MLFSTLVYTVSQLKWDQISSPFKYSVTQQKCVISTTLENLIYSVQIPTKYIAWFLRYKSLKSGTWKRKFPTCERPLQTETVVQTWQIFTLLLIARNFLPRSTPDFISPLVWPPNSPDLDPVDCEVWGVLPQCLYRTTIRNVDHLKHCLIKDWRQFNQDIVDQAVRWWPDGLCACVRENGGHFEYKL